MIWVIAAGVIALAGLLPGLYRSATGTPGQRLIGLQLTSASGLMITIALAMAAGQSSYLIVALVLALLSAAGLLVFTRLLAPEQQNNRDHFEGIFEDEFEDKFEGNFEDERD
jgi:multisubunit Na+/H+ antiporter MnhF subunit